MMNELTDIQTSQKAEYDALRHDDFAQALLANAEKLPPGACISLHGPWGRGKTDILRRVERTLEERAEVQSSPKPIWLNPWQYGTADLLTPMVLQMLERLDRDKRRSGTPALRKAAETLLRAGTAIGFKAASLVAPGGGLYEAVSKPVDNLLAGLFDSLDRQEQKAKELDHDPVEAMARRFRQLVDEFFKLTNTSGGRLMVCIDDLDRCLPDRQVAILEAFHFLGSANARATFIVALDPVLVTQAIAAHYGTTGFDPEQYLNKLFHLRVNLPAINFDDVACLMDHHLAHTVGGWGWFRDTMSPWFGEMNETEVKGDLAYILSSPGLANPRSIERVSYKIRLLLERWSEIPDRFKVPEDYTGRPESFFRDIFTWIGLTEQWPAVRSVFQQFIEMDPDLGSTIQYYYTDITSNPHIPHHIFARLPAREDSSDLRNFMGRFMQLFHLGHWADPLLVSAGL